MAHETATLADFNRMTALWFSILVNRGCAVWNDAGDAIRITSSDLDQIGFALEELEERDPQAFAMVRRYIEGNTGKSLKVTP